MDLTREGYFKEKLERRIESFEIETLLGMVRTIDKTHKHSIEDYKNVIDCYLNCENGKITDLIKFRIEHIEQFYLIFDNIVEEFQNRLRTLKSELINKLYIKKQDKKKLRDIKKLQVITEENESESVSKSESESESDNESNNESIKKKN